MSNRFFVDISFTKYEGTGNDFLFIDDRVPRFPLAEPSLIQRLCHRKFGVGADGIILLQQPTSVGADFQIRILNSDGTEAESCGNGLRCLTCFLADLGLPKRVYQIGTGGGLVAVDFAGDTPSIQMALPRDAKLHIAIGQEVVHFIDTGVPHLVLFVPNVDPIDLSQRGPFFRHHSAFQPRGTNVNFAALQEDGSVRVRTFERGVEGETLACGTGAVAVSLIGALVHNLASPIKTVFPGGSIAVHFLKKGMEFTHVHMVGEARKVFEGRVALPFVDSNSRRLLAKL